jgi:hypothetical protein
MKFLPVFLAVLALAASQVPNWRERERERERERHELSVDVDIDVAVCFRLLLSSLSHCFSSLPTLFPGDHGRVMSLQDPRYRGGHERPAERSQSAHSNSKGETVFLRLLRPMNGRIGPAATFFSHP